MEWYLEIDDIWTVTGSWSNHSIVELVPVSWRVKKQTKNSTAIASNCCFLFCEDTRRKATATSEEASPENISADTFMHSRHLERNICCLSHSDKCRMFLWKEPQFTSVRITGCHLNVHIVNICVCLWVYSCNGIMHATMKNKCNFTSFIDALIF